MTFSGGAVTAAGLEKKALADRGLFQIQLVQRPTQSLSLNTKTWHPLSLKWIKHPADTPN